MTALDTLAGLQGTTWSPGDGSSATIDSWLADISATYSDMAAYCRSLQGAGYFSWCGLTVAYAMTKNGIRPVFGSTDVTKWAYAMGWLENWGTQIPVASAQPGDVAIFNFGGGDHHVTVIKEVSDSTHFLCLGGNQSHAVKESNYAKSQVMGVRRPLQSDAGTSAPTPTTPIPALHSGKTSYYGWFDGQHHWEDSGDDAGSAALGVPDNRQGFACYDRSTLGHWAAVKNPLDGKFYLAQQTDIGPSPRTGRAIDTHARLADAWGYTPDNVRGTHFPTNGVIEWYWTSPPAGTETLSAKQQAASYTAIRTIDPVLQPDPTQPPAPEPAQPSDADIKWMQGILKAKANYTDLIDGEVGPNTIASMITYVHLKEDNVSDPSDPTTTTPTPTAPTIIPPSHGPPPGMDPLLYKVLLDLAQAGSAFLKQKADDINSGTAHSAIPPPSSNALAGIGSAILGGAGFVLSKLPQFSVLGLGLQALATVMGTMGPVVSTATQAPSATAQATGISLLTTLGIGIFNHMFGKSSAPAPAPTPPPATK